MNDRIGQIDHLGIERSFLVGGTIQIKKPFDTEMIDLANAVIHFRAVSAELVKFCRHSLS
jgi:hypothetical protein